MEDVASVRVWGRWSWSRLCTLLALGLVVGLPTTRATGMCPSRCLCDDNQKTYSCVGAALEVVPIQLNPEAAHMNITRNRIANIDYILDLYTRLKVLDISYNKIASLGSKNFGSNTEMKHLYINNNALEALEKYAFTGLKSLVTLDLDFNKISSVNVHTFKDLVSLEELKMSNNKIVSFENSVFELLVNLRVLLLDNNELLDVPTENLAFTINLEHVSLAGNFIENISESAAPSLRRMKRLDVSGNLLTSVHPAALDGLVALQYLNFNDNNLTTVPTTALSKLTNLTHLSLNGNFFEVIPPVSFQGLFHLRHLHLSGLPKLSIIDPRAFVDNINLERIWMNDNIKVSILPTRVFHGNPRLKHIAMKNNDLFTLQASHFPLDQLNSLQLGGNPLHCNCTLLWLWKMGQDHLKQPLPLPNATESTNLLVDFNDLYCASPESIENTLLMRVPESAIRCSMGWILITTIVLSLSILISIAGSILYYFGALKRCSKDKSKHVMTDSDLTSDLPKMSSGLMYSTGRQRPMDDKMEINRYLMIAPPAPESYHSTPPWHTMNKPPIDGDTLESMYQQFGYESIPHHKTMDRPHIVYV